MPEHRTAPAFHSDAQILGRRDVDDLDAIMDVVNRDVHELVHTVEDNADAIFTWDYAKGARPALDKLYEKAKTSQWNASTDLDWSIEVDPETVLVGLTQGGREAGPFAQLAELDGSPFRSFGEAQWRQLGLESVNWRLSQFMHGEQGALLCTAKIVETVPWIDAKYYAATQVMDEARHVEVFAQYLDEKLDGLLPGQHPPEAAARRHHRRQPLGHDLPGHADHGGGPRSGRLRLHAQVTTEPLLKQLLRYVMSDEARHVAFGVLSR